MKDWKDRQGRTGSPGRSEGAVGHRRASLQAGSPREAIIKTGSRRRLNVGPSFREAFGTAALGARHASFRALPAPLTH